MRLNEIQEQFRDLMLGDFQKLDSPPDFFADEFQTGTIALPDRLKVYRNNIIGNLTASLRATFPIIDKLVGPEFFDFMARHYILSHPPTGAWLGDYGDHFDTFVSEFKLAQNLEYLYDTARFEIAMNKAYLAENDNSLKSEELENHSGENLAGLTLKLRNSAHLMASQFPLTDIRTYTLSNGETPAPDMSKGPVFLMIFRPHLDVEIIPLAEDEFHFLENISRNKSLGDTLEAILQKFPDFDLQSFLTRHFKIGSFRTSI